MGEGGLGKGIDRDNREKGLEGRAGRRDWEGERKERRGEGIGGRIGREDWDGGLKGGIGREYWGGLGGRARRVTTSLDLTAMTLKGSMAISTAMAMV